MFSFKAKQNPWILALLSYQNSKAVEDLRYFQQKTQYTHCNILYYHQDRNYINQYIIYKHKKIANCLAQIVFSELSCRIALFSSKNFLFVSQEKIHSSFIDGDDDAGRNFS